MSKFAKGKSWIENRLSSDLELEGSHWIVNLLARKGTGVQGYRVSVVFVSHDGSGDVEAQMPNAASTSDVHRMTRELEQEPDRLVTLFREARKA